MLLQNHFHPIYAFIHPFIHSRPRPLAAFRMETEPLLKGPIPDWLCLQIDVIHCIYLHLIIIALHVPAHILVFPKHFFEMISTFVDPFQISSIAFTFKRCVLSSISSNVLRSTVTLEHLELTGLLSRSITSTSQSLLFLTLCEAAFGRKLISSPFKSRINDHPSRCSN